MIWKIISENKSTIIFGTLLIICMVGKWYISHQDSKIKALEATVQTLNNENEKYKQKINSLTTEYEKISNAVESYDKTDQKIKTVVSKNNSSIKSTINSIKSGDSSNNSESINKFNELNKTLMNELMSINRNEESKE